MNILHLSDIHFGRNYARYNLKDSFKKHDQILDELIETIKNLSDDLKPEHILFTGDIAWRGMTDEFDEAYIFFKKLLDSLGLEGKDISFCVGNHDIEREYKCVKDDIDNYSIEKIDYYYQYENIHLFNPTILHYNEFCKKLGVVPYSYPVENKRKYSYTAGYKDVTFKDGNTLRFVSFNTSMLQSQNKITSDKLWIGKPQVDTLVEYGILPKPNDISYSIALYHHSDRFLHPNETSTYDGRTATLPLLLGLTDLMLCGHTESSGKPRLTRQRGGGQILLGGATYYSDDHLNAFSMLYVNPIKKSFGYIPYVYDNGWNDIDVINEIKSNKKNLSLPKINTVLEDCTLVCKSEKDFCIPLSYVEQNDKNFDSEIDFLNPFSITIKDELKIGLESSLKNDVSAVLSYIDFLKNTYNEFILYDKDKNILFKSDKAIIEKIDTKDLKLLKELNNIENYYGLHFTLDRPLTKKENYAIKLLTTLSDFGIYDYETVPKQITLKVSESDLKDISLKAKQGKDIYLYEHGMWCNSLLNTDVCVRNTIKVTGPFKVDIKDLKEKTRTVKKGDIREIVFLPYQNVYNQIIKKDIVDYIKLMENDLCYIDITDKEYVKEKII